MSSMYIGIFIIFIHVSFANTLTWSTRRFAVIVRLLCQVYPY